MQENPTHNLLADRDKQIQEQTQSSQQIARQATEIAAVQQQIQAGEIGGSRQQHQHASRHFWQVAGAPETIVPEAKIEREQQRQKQQDRDDFGFSR